MNEELLSAYLDGELTEADAAEVEARLGTDTDFAAELDSIAKTRTLLRGLGAVAPTEGLFDRLRPVEEAAEAPNVVSLADERAKRRWLAPAGALAGAVAAAVLLVALFASGGVTATVPDVEQLAARHTAAITVGETDGFVSMSDEDMADMATMDPDMGMEMMGAYESGEVTQTVYSDGEHEMSVYAEPGTVDWEGLSELGGSMVDDGSGKEWHYNTDGLEVLVVERNEKVVVVVGDPEMGDSMISVADAVAT